MDPQGRRILKQRALLLLLLLPLFLFFFSARSHRPPDDDGGNRHRHHDHDPNRPPQDTHADTWAVLVGTSRYWHNYRHTTNPLLLYRLLRDNGVPDRNIVLMLAGDTACDPRSARPGCVQLYDEKNRCLTEPGEVEVDFRGEEVTVDAFLQVLTGLAAGNRGDPRSSSSRFGVGSRSGSLPPPRLVSARQSLQATRASNVFVYLTGHGGDGFLKFQDAQELTAKTFALSLRSMHLRGRFRELLIVLDTCQASSLFDQLDAPNVLAVASSKTGQNAWSYGFDPDNGVSTTDRFTYFLHQHLRGNGGAAFPAHSPSVGDLLLALRERQVRSVPHLRNTMNRSVEHVALADFLTWPKATAEREGA